MERDLAQHVAESILASPKLSDTTIHAHSAQMKATAELLSQLKISGWCISI
jgi:hypothetical protein